MIDIYTEFKKAAPDWNPDTPPVEPSGRAKAAHWAFIKLPHGLPAGPNGENLLNAAAMVASVRHVDALGLAEFAPTLSWIVMKLMGANFVPFDVSK